MVKGFSLVIRRFLVVQRSSVACKQPLTRMEHTNERERAFLCIILRISCSGEPDTIPVQFSP